VQPPESPSHRLTRWLAAAPVPLFSTYAVAAAFATYFCMYAVRKPFTAASYADQSAFGLELKSALVISQVFGYALSKMLGIKFNSELPPARRLLALLGLIAAAELALVGFALAPAELQVLALFCNGLPLGAVWGLVFSFLEGRRSSEILGAGLSCSYIVASGFVKSVGAALLARGVPEQWMPAATGLLFLPGFVLSACGLSLLPAPSREDVAARVGRAPMFRAQRRAFVARYWPGLAGLVLVYALLTALRDFRDNFAAELWQGLGTGGAPEVFTRSEVPIAFAVMLVLSLLYRLRDNRLGLLVTFAIMTAGTVLVGLSTLLWDAGRIGGMSWMILVGLGLYLGYVPYGCVLFDRMIASLGVVATAVFLIYVSDAVAYPGSVVALLVKQFAQPDRSFLQFFRWFAYVTAVAGTALLVASGAYFLRRSRSA
jgi:hypothetical protein